jgi:putative DNA-binding protein
MNRPAPDLRQTQRLFWALITAPEGARPAAEELRRKGTIGPGEIDSIFSGDDRLPALDRLDIYANMYFYRLLDCLAEDFPRVLEALGRDRFHNLVTDYLLAHPSGSPSLRLLGRRFAEFAKGHAISSEFPYLADLARLDWARVDVFDAPEAPALTRENLGSLPADRAGEATFELIPALRILRLEYDIARVWRTLQEGRAGPSRRAGKDDAVITTGCASSTDSRSPEAEDHVHAVPARGPRRVPHRPAAIRVWRSGFAVYHRSMQDEEARCLEMIGSGDNLARICQQIAAGRSIERATERVGRILQGWIEDGILAAGPWPRTAPPVASA